MSDPVGEVMKKLTLDAQEKATATPGKAPKEKLFNNKYYRTVNIDLTAEEQAAVQAEAKKQAAAKKQKEDEESAQKEAEMKKLLQGMGFNVK